MNNRQKNLPQFDIIRVLVFFLAPLSLLLFERYKTGTIGIQTPDSRLYWGIAENYFTNGIFMQTKEPVVNYVVPPVVPLIITGFRFCNLKLRAICVLQCVLFGMTNVFIYDVERRITFHRIPIASAAYTLAFMKSVVYLSSIYVEFYYLFLVALIIRIMFSDVSESKKYFILNVSGLILFMCRPVAGIIYAVILFFTFRKLFQEKRVRWIIFSVLFPVLLLSINYRWNKSMTGEGILLESYSGQDIYLASLPDADTDYRYTNGYTDEIYNSIYNDPLTTMKQKSEQYRVIAKENFYRYPLQLLHNAGKRFFNLFFTAYKCIPLLTLCAAIAMIVNEKDARFKRKYMIILAAEGVLATITAFGLPVLRYSLIIWSVAGWHASWLFGVCLDYTKKVFK